MVVLQGGIAMTEAEVRKVIAAITAYWPGSCPGATQHAWAAVLVRYGYRQALDGLKSLVTQSDRPTLKTIVEAVRAQSPSPGRVLEAPRPRDAKRSARAAMRVLEAIKAGQIDKDDEAGCKELYKKLWGEG